MPSRKRFEKTVVPVLLRRYSGVSERSTGGAVTSLRFSPWIMSSFDRPCALFGLSMSRKMLFQYAHAVRRQCQRSSLCRPPPLLAFLYGYFFAHGRVYRWNSLATFFCDFVPTFNGKRVFRSMSSLPREKQFPSSVLTLSMTALRKVASGNAVFVYCASEPHEIFGILNPTKQLYTRKRDILSYSFTRFTLSQEM